MMYGWFAFGLIGWVGLMLFRLLTEGRPKAPVMGYVNGFVFSLLLGPFAVSWLVALIIFRSRDDKANK